MLQPVVSNFPVNPLNLEIWCGYEGVRLRAPPVCVPNTCPSREELAPRREHWTRHWGQRPGWWGPFSYPWSRSIYWGRLTCFSQPQGKSSFMGKLNPCLQRAPRVMGDAYRELDFSPLFWWKISFLSVTASPLTSLHPIMGVRELQILKANPQGMLTVCQALF